MPTFNGHRSWNAWNVSLWINNDEGLYNFARECVRTEKTRAGAVRAFLSFVGKECTPDGARYNMSCVREAMEGME
jgi:hypothetical protein